MRLSLRTDRRLLRAEARSTRYLLASITAPAAPARASRMPVNVGFVLDRSGSMDGDRKFGLAREAVEQALRLLHPEDRFTLVVYDQEVDVLAPATLATPEAKGLALSRLRAVGPRGSTDLHAGWATAASQIGTTLRDDTVTRVLLLTDGLANHGITEPVALRRMSGELRRLGIATSTFGVGADFDERLLRDIAHEGGGNFYFIESPAQIADLLSSELGEAVEVVARDAVLQVGLPARAEAEVLNRFRVTEAAHDELHVHIGDLVSEQELRVVVRIRFASGTLGSSTKVEARVVDRSGAQDGPPAICEWEYADHAANDAQPRAVIVDREVASLHAARARAEATEANRRADFQRARHVLERTALRIDEYAGEDTELRALARALRDDVQRYAEQAMSPMQLKSAFYVAESAAKNRGSDGKARRSPGRNPR
jgi:Ca-activated chloride channel family protein